MCSSRWPSPPCSSVGGRPVERCRPGTVESMRWRTVSSGVQRNIVAELAEIQIPVVWGLVIAVPPFPGRSSSPRPPAFQSSCAAPQVVHPAPSLRRGYTQLRLGRASSTRRAFSAVSASWVSAASLASCRRRGTSCTLSIGRPTACPARMEGLRLRPTQGAKARQREKDPTPF